jgi:metal-responsive CopG/Arc/MetJ family transcriptional regulator
MRTIVNLPEEDLEAIKAIAKRERVSQAEAMRRAVKAYLANNPPEPDPAAFGLWAGRTEGLRYQEALREEWSR